MARYKDVPNIAPTGCKTCNNIDEIYGAYTLAWLLGRRSSGPDEQSNTKINGNQNSLISVYSIHRDDRYRDDSKAFLPERFIPEKKKANTTINSFHLVVAQGCA